MRAARFCTQGLAHAGRCRCMTRISAVLSPRRSGGPCWTESRRVFCSYGKKCGTRFDDPKATPPLAGRAALPGTFASDASAMVAHGACSGNFMSIHPNV
jgi:hypothetical protein